MNYSIKETQKGLSYKKLENYLKMCKIVQWGRKNPIYFIRDFLGLEMLDYQKYTFMKSWSTPNVLWCFSRNGAKTTMGSIFIMTKALLVPSYRVYILSGSGQQSQELFLKIEDIVKKNVPTFVDATDVYFNETVKSAANTTGFTHNPQSFGFDLYNGSRVRTLNSDYDNNRGKRSHLNFYDESGFINEEMFAATEPFVAQNSDFRLGSKNSIKTLPKQFQNQIIYASSASSMDTYFFSKYKDFSKKMFLGDKRFFVADINCEAVMKATFNGVLFPTPLLVQDTIDTAMRENKEKALREYYNKFTTEGGDNQIVKRATIIRNTEPYLPVFYNDTGNRNFIMAYDPSHEEDGSVVIVAELLKDKNIGYFVRIVNCISFLDVNRKSKRQLRTPEQIGYIKNNILLNYNGRQSADYENLDKLIIDAGAGGGGHIIGDFLMEDWTDDKGKKHKGLIDKEISAEHVNKFPNAVNNLILANPKKYKNEMFSALEEMTKLDLIKFPKEYDMKGFIYINEDVVGEGTEQIDDGEEVQKIERKMIKKQLSSEEELSLKQIDLAKEEIVNIYRYENGTSVKYELPPDKIRKMHDDRAYCLAMIAWRLQQLRRENITNKKREINVSISDLFNFKQPQIRKY